MTALWEEKVNEKKYALISVALHIYRMVRLMIIRNMVRNKITWKANAAKSPKTSRGSEPNFTRPFATFSRCFPLQNWKIVSFPSPGEVDSFSSENLLASGTKITGNYCCNRSDPLMCVLGHDDENWCRVSNVQHSVVEPSNILIWATWDPKRRYDNLDSLELFEAQQGILTINPNTMFPEEPATHYYDITFHTTQNQNFVFI